MHACRLAALVEPCQQGQLHLSSAFSANRRGACMQARVKAVAEIVSKLVEGVTAGQDVDLNAIKRDATLRYKVRNFIVFLRN